MRKIKRLIAHDQVEQLGRFAMVQRHAFELLRLLAERVAQLCFLHLAEGVGG